MRASLSKSLARENTRTINEIGSQEESENTRVRRQADSEITRLTRSLLRPTKGSSVPIQKEGTGPKSCQRRRTRPQSKRSGRFSQSDGERLKVVYLVVVKVVYMEVEMGDKGSERRSSLLVAPLLAAGSKEEEGK